MRMEEAYIVKVEEGREASHDKPSAGPVYRCIYAKDSLLHLPPHLDSPWQFFRDSASKYPSKAMLGRRQKSESEVDPYKWLTYQEAYETAIRIGSAMSSRGVNPACNSHSVTYVPLYDTLGPNAVEFIINHAQVSIAFVQENKIPSCSSNLKSMSNDSTFFQFLSFCYIKANFLLFNANQLLQSNNVAIVSFGNVLTAQKKVAEEHGTSCFSWEEFLQLGNLDCDLPPKKKTDICTIMYTSGTTGEPKGVIIKNEAFMAEVLSIDQILHLTDKAASEDDVYFSFLPLAHVYDQIMETYCIYRGASIGFWQGDVRYLMEDVQVLKPTIFCGVPRVFDRVYAGINSKISSGGALRSALFHKLGYLEKGLPQDKAAPFFDRLVFDKIKQGLGGRVRLLLSGAAPLPRHIEEFLRITSGATLAQGYGLTESCGGCFTALGNVFSMMGTVGVPMTTIEARLESVPEMGYDALSSEPRGEICLRGTTLFSGYHKREDLTEEVMVDGWFHTGDIGEWQPNGAMKIIDRKKNIFKLSQGEYVSVENIENKYLRCPLITSIWVYGNSFESFLVAVVVPDRKALEDWAVKHNSSTDDFKSLCENLKARKYILDELNSTGQKHQLRGFEMLKAIHLEPAPFDMERDLITPTFKLKRPQLLKYYKDCIEELYKEAKGTKV
ncbi:hypothetical protein Ahy_A03g016594 isoform B [Arachis hypogaea]|uniref:Long-chain-fatty-acid--CoA ligase n=1 Tax=Arachis hypogaea TaxID=3818 RepID=A0A445E3S7_ARAHY|nr:hypothetical protein Ahy_A03g016594 isoform B [Arachis hypogaea]